MPVSPIAASISPMPCVRSSIRTGSPGGIRWDYGEDRYRLLAAIEGRVFVLIYTMRGSAIRIISARKANGKEVREYEYKTRED